MTRERAKELWPVIQAYAEGKKVQGKWTGKQFTDPEWMNLDQPDFDNGDMQYRIKPEPREFWITPPRPDSSCRQGTSIDGTCGWHVYASKIPTVKGEIHVREVID